MPWYKNIRLPRKTQKANEHRARLWIFLRNANTLEFCKTSMDNCSRKNKSFIGAKECIDIIFQVEQPKKWLETLKW